jgi:hypothetical protein
MRRERVVPKERLVGRKVAARNVQNVWIAPHPGLPLCLPPYHRPAQKKCVRDTTETSFMRHVIRLIYP